MPYLTETEYQEMTGREVPENFAFLEERASAELDSVTRFFYQFHDLESDIPFRKKQFKRAMMVQIKFFVDRGMTTAEELNAEPDSIKVGATTVTRNRTRLGQTQEARTSVISLDALNMLAGTGLLYRGSSYA